MTENTSREVSGQTCILDTLPCGECRPGGMNGRRLEVVKHLPRGTRTKGSSDKMDWGGGGGGGGGAKPEG